MKAIAVGEAPAGAQGAPSDGDLLGCFAAARDEAAFRALVERHGGMVYYVCRRVLRDPHEAEDAFQATFLILAQKAAAIRHPQLLANWLYGVAYRVARKAKAKMQPPKPESVQEADPAGEPSLQAAWHEVAAALDEELSRLPDKYRAPLVLCYLQGKSRQEAAALLECSPGSMSWRVGKGRELLRKRLQRRGMALSLMLLLLGMSARASAAPTLVARTVAVALPDAAPAPILALAEAAQEGDHSWGKMVLAIVFLLLGLGAAAASIGATLPQRDSGREHLLPSQGAPSQGAGGNGAPRMGGCANR